MMPLSTLGMEPTMPETLADRLADLHPRDPVRRPARRRWSSRPGGGSWTPSPAPPARSTSRRPSDRAEGGRVGPIRAGFVALRRGTVVARLGGIRQRRPHPLPRLQRHLPLARTGASERQLGGRHGGRRARRGRRPRPGSPPPPSPTRSSAASPTPASIRARGWDHVTYGALSTSLAASKLLGLDHARTVHALGIAGTTSAALRLTRAGELSMWKGCAFAHAARNGVFAALLAREGMTGPFAPLFEGDMGFWQQVSGPFEIAQLGGPTGSDWMLPKTSIKFVPAEYHSQSAIAAAFELRPLVGDPSRIKLDRDRHVPGGRRDHRPGPREVAAQDPRDRRPQPALLHGGRPGRWSRSRPSNSARRPAGGPCACSDLVARTTVVEDPTLTAGYPAGIPNRVTVTLDDGTTLVSEIAFPPGHDKNPLTDAQLAAKFHGLVDPVLGRGRGEAIWKRISNLESDPRPHEAVALLDRPA